MIKAGKKPKINIPKWDIAAIVLSSPPEFIGLCSGIDGGGWAYRASVQGTTPSQALGGSTPYGPNAAGRIYRIEVAGMVTAGYPKVRRSNRAFLVPYEQLSNKLQQINKLGGRVASVTPA